MSKHIRIIDHKPVVSCKEASVERGVELKYELKTLLLKVCKYYIAVHLKGSDRLKVREIKRLFKCENCVFVSKAFLENSGLQPGTINPWNTNFCHFHLICSRVFENSIMTTNNSKKNQGVFFDVFELLNKENVIIGNFGKHE